MKAIMRSLYYWIYNMEKVFLIMIATMAAVLLIQLLMQGEAERMDIVVNVLEGYTPMLGSLFALAMSMSCATYYIPQSLTSGGSRKEVYIGMQAGFHLLLAQMLLLVLLIIWLLPASVLQGSYFRLCAVMYLLFLGIGNILSMCSLKFGGKTGMIIYMLMIVLLSGTVGALAALSNHGFIKNLLELAGSNGIFIAALLFDLVTMLICWLPFRNYEVRV